MITDFDRSGIIGASDTDYVVGNWTTKTFDRWWMEKVGLIEHEQVDNIYTTAGTLFEIPVLECMESAEGIAIEKGQRVAWDNERVVVNLDGNTLDTIYEVKCVGIDKAMDYPQNVPIKYWRQVQVQMLVTGIRKAYIVAYGLLGRDYEMIQSGQVPTVLDIEYERIFCKPINYDDEWLGEYQRKVNYLTRCLDTGEYPRAEEIW